MDMTNDGTREREVMGLLLTSLPVSDLRIVSGMASSSHLAGGVASVLQLAGLDKPSDD